MVSTDLRFSSSDGYASPYFYLAYCCAILGTAAGVEYNKGKSRTAIRDGLIGGGAGLAGTTAAGLIAEEFRRRAGSVSNEELTEYQS